MSRKTKNILGAVLVAALVIGVSYFRTTFVSRAIFTGIWLLAVVTWILLKD